MKYNIDEFSFSEGHDYLDVIVHHAEKWIELKIATTDSFPIYSQKDLDLIYSKLTEVLKSFDEKD